MATLDRTPIPERLHRVRLAFRWLTRRPRVTGKAIQTLLGHAVRFMMLKRELLSIPNHLYAFVQHAKDGKRRLWASAAVEAKWIGQLLPLCSADLRKQTSTLLTAWDASLSGIAVCVRETEKTTVEQIGSFRVVCLLRRHRGGLPACCRYGLHQVGLWDVVAV